MKRVIKFWNKFRDEGFSDCGTEYEVLPILVQDSAGPKELRAIAKQLGINTRHQVKTLEVPTGWTRGRTHATHMLKTGQKTEPMYFEKKEYDWYLGFVTLNESGPLKPVEKIGKKMTKENMRQIIEDRQYGLDDVGDFSQLPNKRDSRIIMENWNYYHEIKMLGYDMNHFERAITGKRKDSEVERNFNDSVSSCSECGTWDHNDNGYTYNHRYVDDKGTLGLNCGCYDEYCKSNFLEFAGDTKNPMELELAEELEKDGFLEHVERFIGGMTDGRGGYFKGKSTREGDPGVVLQEYQGKESKSVFLFTHDESGQFQTYFSLWRVTKKGLKQNKKAA